MVYITTLYGAAGEGRCMKQFSLHPRSYVNAYWRHDKHTIMRVCGCKKPYAVTKHAGGNSATATKRVVEYFESLKKLNKKEITIK